MFLSDTYGNKERMGVTHDHFKGFMQQIVDAKTCNPATIPAGLAKTSPSLPEPIDGCVVCGKKSTGRHYGAITCESCRCFFRRTVRKHRLDPGQRGQSEGSCGGRCMAATVSCTYCRYRRCIHAGMDPSRILGEKERVALEHLVQENRHRLQQEDEDSAAAAAAADGNMNTPQTLIDTISSTYCQIFTSPPTEDPEVVSQASEGGLVVRNEEVWTLLLQSYKPSVIRIINFIHSIPGFKTVQERNRRVLLRRSVLDIMFFRLSLRYNSQDMSYPLRGGKHITRSEAENFRGGELWSIVGPLFDFGYHMARLQLTDTEVASMIAILALQTDLDGLQELTEVERIHDLVLQACQHHSAHSSSDDLRYFTFLMKVTRIRCLANQYGKTILRGHPNFEVSQLLTEIFEDVH